MRCWATNMTAENKDRLTLVLCRKGTAAVLRQGKCPLNFLAAPGLSGLCVKSLRYQLLTEMQKLSKL